MQDLLESVRAESLRMTLLEAVQRVTAFSSNAAMLERMADHGYCPTLRVTDEPMGVEEGRDNHAVRLIRAWVLDNGCSYFDGRRVVKPTTYVVVSSDGYEEFRDEFTCQRHADEYATEMYEASGIPAWVEVKAK